MADDDVVVVGAGHAALVAVSVREQGASRTGLMSGAFGRIASASAAGA